MPQTPHIEKHFTASETVRDIVIGMSDGLTRFRQCDFASIVFATTYDFTKLAWHYTPAPVGTRWTTEPQARGASCTVGGMATPTLWNTRPAVPCNSLRNR